MTLGEKIREARKMCGLSQEQLADKMCVSRSAVAKWETDKGLPDVGNLKVLARLLNTSVDYLLDEGQSAEQSVICEAYNLHSYGRGCKKVKKDRVVREKFPDARICALLGRRELTPSMDKVERVSNNPNADKEFYLVEYDGRQFFVTITDTVVQTKALEVPITDNQFSLDGWDFIKCNYEVEGK